MKYCKKVFISKFTLLYFKFIKYCKKSINLKGFNKLFFLYPITMKKKRKNYDGKKELVKNLLKFWQLRTCLELTEGAVLEPNTRCTSSDSSGKGSHCGRNIYMYALGRKKTLFSLSYNSISVITTIHCYSFLIVSYILDYSWPVGSNWV